MRRVPTALIWVGLAAIVLLAYGNSFDAGLTLDSKSIIGADPRLHGWSAENLRRILTENYWWPSTRSDLYRPLTTFSYLANYTAFGNGPAVFAYHAVNFLLHGANVALLFALVRRLSGRRWVAALAAGLFAVHPVNVEAVTNIVGRADLLAALAVLAAAWCYVQSTVSPKGRMRWLILAGAIGVLGTFAKENAIMVVAFIVLYDFIWRWPPTSGMTLRGAAQWIRQCAWPGWMMFLPAVILLLGVRHALAAHLVPPGKAYVDDILYAAAPLQRILTACAVLAREVGLLVFPATLSCDYSYGAIPLYGPAAGTVDNLLAWIGVALAVGGIVAILRWRARVPLAAWAIASFFILLLPTANLLFPTGSIMGERFLYLPSIGICTLVALACARLAAVPSGTPARPDSSIASPAGTPPADQPRDVTGRYFAFATVLAATLLTALAWRTHLRNRDWRDELSLWRSALHAAPASFKVHKAYAQAVWERGKDEAALDQALAETEKARRILEPLPLEQRDESLYLQLAIYSRFKSELSRAAHRPAESADFRRRAIAALAEAQKIDETASVRFVAAARERLGPGAAIAAPGNVQIYLERAVCEQQAEDWPAVRAAAMEAERYAPGLSDGYALTGVAEFHERHFDLAVVHFLAGLIVAPGNLELAQNLGRAYRQLGFAEPPINVSNGRFVVGPAPGRSEADLRAAFTLLIHNHLDAGLPSVAKELREAAQAQFGIALVATQ